MKQNKRIPLSQEKPLFKPQQRIPSVCGPLYRIWPALEVEKESMVDSGENLNEEHSQAEISQLLHQVLILLGKSVYTY